MTNELKSYPVPWRGHLLLACRKCQKKLKRESTLKSLSNLKKNFKTRAKHRPENPLHVLNIPCMDVCPKQAVAVCLFGAAQASMHLLRSEEDLDRLAASLSS